MQQDAELLGEGLWGCEGRRRRPWWVRSRPFITGTAVGKGAPGRECHSQTTASVWSVRLAAFALVLLLESEESTFGLVSQAELSSLLVEDPGVEGGGDHCAHSVGAG